MLGLLFIPAATQRVAQIVLCGLMIGSPGGIDFVQNTEKLQAWHNSCVHLVCSNLACSKNDRLPIQYFNERDS